MVDFIEALVLLLPPEAGGRCEPVAPREGSYRPRIGSMHVRFIEGPPSIAPGCSGLVVMEIESAADADLISGSELQIMEDGRVVGMLTVTRRFKMVA